LARLDSSRRGPAIEELAARFRLVLLDNRGSGRSDPLSQTVKIADMVRDVVSVLDDAGIAQTTALGPASAGSWRRNSPCCIRGGSAGWCWPAPRPGPICVRTGTRPGTATSRDGPHASIQ